MSPAEIRVLRFLDTHARWFTYNELRRVSLLQAGDYRCLPVLEGKRLVTVRKHGQRSHNGFCYAINYIGLKELARYEKKAFKK